MLKRSTLLCVWLALGGQAAVAADLALPNRYFKTADEVREYLLANSGKKGMSLFLPGDEEDWPIVEPGPKQTWRLRLEGIHRELDKDNNQNSETVTVLMDYSYPENRVIGGTGRMAGIEFCKGYSVDACYAMPKVPPEQQERAAIIARYYVNERVPQVLVRAHKDALADFRKGRKADAANTAAALIQAAPWQVVPVTAENVESYNDLGFFLGDGGKYKEAVPVLEEVTRAIPDRAPAFLNLGDAYAGLSDTEHARAAYRQYQKLMEQSGSGAKIPKRIQKYLDK